MERAAGGFEHFEHGADVGIRGFGESAEEAFVAAAMALFSLVDEQLRHVRNTVQEEITCEAPGLEELLVAFLNELISLADSRRLVFGQFDFRIEVLPSGAARLTGKALGEPYDPSRHQGTVEPKGATYTALRVAREGNRWVAQCVIDV